MKNEFYFVQIDRLSINKSKFDKTQGCFGILTHIINYLHLWKKKLRCEVVDECVLVTV